MKTLRDGVGGRRGRLCLALALRGQSRLADSLGDAVQVEQQIAAEFQRLNGFFPCVFRVTVSGHVADGANMVSPFAHRLWNVAAFGDGFDSIKQSKVVEFGRLIFHRLLDHSSGHDDRSCRGSQCIGGIDECALNLIGKGLGYLHLRRLRVKAEGLRMSLAKVSFLSQGSCHVRFGNFNDDGAKTYRAPKQEKLWSHLSAHGYGEKCGVACAAFGMGAVHDE